MTEHDDDRRNSHKVYLLHFSEPIGALENPYGRAQHYLGCTGDLERRIHDHRSGRGAAVTRAAVEAGCTLDVVRTWDGGFALEKRLRGWHDNPALCPVCNGALRSAALASD